MTARIPLAAITALALTSTLLAVWPAAAGALWFTPSPDNPISSSSEDTTAVAASDFNGDGTADLASGSAGASSSGVRVWISDGSGGFDEAPGSPYLSGDPVSALREGDLDGDGEADLVAYAASGVHALIGSGSGSFTDASTTPMTPIGSSNSMELADVNSDGDLDLITAGYVAKYQVALGDGDGTFTALPAQTVTAPGANGFEALAVGDFDGDGSEDLAAANYPNPFSATQYWGIYALRGASDGTFAEVSQSPFLLPDGGFPKDVAAAQTIPGGADELLVSSLNQKVESFRSDPDEFLRNYAPGTFFTGVFPIELNTADYNRDGFLDVATADFGSTGISVGAGDGSGALTDAGSFTLGENYFPSGLASADFNGDGAIDTASPSSSSSPATIEGVGVLLAARDVRINPDEVEFEGAPIIAGEVSPPETVTVTNSGALPLTVSSAQISSGDADQFELADGCDAELAPGGECELEVRLAPSSGGRKDSILYVSTDAEEALVPIPITGEAVAQKRSAKLSVSAGERKLKAGKKIKLRAVCENTGNVSLRGARVGVRAPKRLAKKKTAVAGLAQLTPGEKKSATLKLKTKKTARAGRYELVVKCSAQGLDPVEKKLRVKIRR